MTQIQVIWATAIQGDAVPASVVFTVPEWTDSDAALCEALFRETNTYAGDLWDAMQPLPDGRTHTALSVGDYVIIGDRLYVCRTLGWGVTDDFIPGLLFRDHPSSWHAHGEPV